MEETFNDFSFVEALNLKFKAIHDAVQAIVDYLKPLFEAVAKWIKSFGDAIYQWYLQAGAPYGETMEGCQRWLEERFAANRKRQELEAQGMWYGQEVPLNYLLYLDKRFKRWVN